VELLVGLGGGSALDSTKATALLAVHEGPMSRYFGLHKVPSACMPTILIPTTAGTGSEMTSNAVLNDPITDSKQGTVSDYLYAKVVLLDPELTAGLPPFYTAITGLDALVHCIESYVSLHATPFTDALNLQAMRMISDNIRKVYANGGNMEAREQMLAECGKLPVAAFACVGGGSNAIGLFAGFVDDADVRLIGVEPAGRGLTYGDHAASLCKGEPGVMHGFHSYMIKDENGEPGAVYSISAGLDYPSVGPEHSYLKDIGRAEYVSVTDKEAVDAFFLLSRTEGIIPALESSHALAQAVKVAPTLPKDAALLVCLSGRGDKDVEQMEAFLESAK
jgi:hypothetical protein